METIRVSELENAETRTVFVLNRTDPIGTVCMTIKSQDGDVSSLRVPRTWIPVEVSEQVDKHTLLKSHSFRQAIFNGTLDLVSDADAEEVLASEEGRAEYKSMRERMRTMSTQGNITRDLKDDTEKEATVSPQVLEIMERENVSDAERYSVIRTIEAQLTSDDLAYIMKKATHPNLTKYVKGLSEKANNGKK